LNSILNPYSFILFSFLLLTCAGCESPKKKDNAITETTGKADLNDIKLSDLDGEGIKLADFKGKIIFLNFWATWCKPCIAEMPSIQRAMGKIDKNDIVFLAASDESVEKIEKFRSRFDFSFQFIQVLDDYANLEIWSLPTTIIYDRKGKIVVNEAGARDWDADDIIEMLSGL